MVAILLIVLLLAGNLAGAAAPSPRGPRPAAGWPRILGNPIFGEAAVADLDGDGRDEIAVGLRDGQVFLLGPDGRNWPNWPRSVAGPVYQSVAFIDLDGAGPPEVVAASYDGAIHAWRSDGRPMPGWPVDLRARIVASPRAAPHAGVPTVLIATGDGLLHRLGPDGGPVPGWPVATSPRRSGIQVLNALTVAELDGQSPPEILLLSDQGQSLQAWLDDGRPLPGFSCELGEVGRGLAVLERAGDLHLACTTLHRLTLLARDGSPIWTHQLADPADVFTSAPAFIVGPDERVLLAAGTQRGRVHLLDLQGRLLPGWPQELLGFIYGLAGDEERFGILAPPTGHDVDGDGVPEIVVPSYDQHVYALELDGEPVPGWPLTLGDSARAAPVAAQLDGRGAPELLVTQSGETLFAFQLEPGPEMAPWPVPREGSRSATVLTILVVLALALLVAHALRDAPWRSSGLAAAIIATVLLCLLAVSAVRYAQQSTRLDRLRPSVTSTLDQQRHAVEARAADLVAGLDSVFTEQSAVSGRLLYHLERLADRQRLSDELSGVAVLGPGNRPRQAIGLLRRWSESVAAIGGDDPGASLVLLGENPTLVARRWLQGPLAGSRLVHATSLIGDFPHQLARTTGTSVELRVRDRAVAREGTRPGGAMRARPLLGLPVPRADVEIGSGELVVRLTDDPHAEGWLGWILVATGLLLPVYLMTRWTRRDPAWNPRAGPVCLVALGVLYLAGCLLLAGGSFHQRPVSFAGYLLELLLHLAGWTGIVVILHRLVGTSRSRRLSVALAASYLAVALLPLSVTLMIATNLVQQAQQAATRHLIADLELRADHLALAHRANSSFRAGVLEMARDRLGQPPETGWFNFAIETQYVFTYDLPTAYLTVDVHDRDRPEFRFTGFSWRVPRTEKFPSPRPAWAEGADPRGLFVDGNRAVVRAARTYRTPELEALIVAHLPLDATILDHLAEDLRILPFLPRVQLEPAWLASTSVVDPQPGWRLPLATRLDLPARDWRSGEQRWLAYDAWAVLPSGGEMILVLFPVLAMILVPLGLSAWGAAGAWRRTVAPLNRLLAGIRRLAAGDLEVRLGHAGTSEIAAASRAFDDMADSLRGTIRAETERRKAEELSALKSHFLSMVSHDLKTPLASIQGATENLVAGLAGPLNERQLQYLQMVLQSSVSLRQMVTDILDLTRIESGHLQLELEDIDLRREIEQVVHSLRPLLEQRDLRAEITVTAEHQRVRADRTRLWQVLTNVLSNAVHHSPRQGRIGIHLADLPGDFVRTTITDQGPGIPASERNQVFEAHYARHRTGGGTPGAGLGLAIVKQVVELHGGQVAVRDAAGGGTRLCITLPTALDPRGNRAESAHHSGETTMTDGLSSWEGTT